MTAQVFRHISGPGSGKTHTLLSFVSQEQERGLALRDLTFCSFTRSQRDDVRVRMAALFPDATADEIHRQIRTVHGVALTDCLRHGLIPELSRKNSPIISEGTTPQPFEQFCRECGLDYLSPKKVPEPGEEADALDQMPQEPHRRRGADHDRCRADRQLHRHAAGQHHQGDQERSARHAHHAGDESGRERKGNRNPQIDIDQNAVRLEGPNAPAPAAWPRRPLGHGVEHQQAGENEHGRKDHLQGCAVKAVCHRSAEERHDAGRQSDEQRHAPGDRLVLLAILYAAMNDIPICIADHLEVVPPSQVRETMVGMWIAWYIDLPT